MRTHKQTAALLTATAFVVSMAFFAVVRAFGLLWFSHDPPVMLPEWIEPPLIVLFFLFDHIVILKILTDAPWKQAAVVSVLWKLLDVAIYQFTENTWVYFALCALFTILIPLALNREKDKSLGYSILFFVVINVYQLLMMFGRGYPAESNISAVWQVIGLIDYRFFLLSLLSMRGVVEMGHSCFLWFGKGKISAVAETIGHAALSPFRAAARMLKRNHDV